MDSSGRLHCPPMRAPPILWAIVAIRGAGGDCRRRCCRRCRATTRGRGSCGAAELVDPQPELRTGGGPSWKPLPVMFTTIYRALRRRGADAVGRRRPRGGLLGSGRGLQARRAARPGHEPDPLAGADRWCRRGARARPDTGFLLLHVSGTSEPLLIATALWAVERLLAGRHGQAFVFAVALSLIRPEAWPFLACHYATWLWIRRPALRRSLPSGSCRSRASGSCLLGSPPGSRFSRPLATPGSTTAISAPARC